MNNSKNIFRLNPSSDWKDYIAWLERLETKYANHWSKIGIFYLQLSKLNISNIDILMVMVTALFRNHNTCALELLCVRVTPIFLNVTTITGLMPTREKYLLESFTNTIKPKILNWEKNSFGGGQTKKTNNPITNREHLAFMLYWVCTHCIYTKSIQVPTDFYNLTLLLHIGEPWLCLTKLLLENVYQAFTDAANNLRWKEHMDFLDPFGSNSYGSIWSLNHIWDVILDFPCPWIRSCKIDLLHSNRKTLRRKF